MEKIKIMGIFAHPDDEFGMAGTIVKAISLGIEISLVCATKGEAGKIRNEKQKQLKNMSTSQIREEEYLEACNRIGISKCCFLGLEDGNSKNWDKKTAISDLIDVIEQECPTLIFSFDLNGINGHPDHKALSHICQKVCSMKGIELIQITKFPETYVKKKLWWLPRNAKKRLMNKICVKDDRVTAVYKLNKEELLKKLSILDVYRSQFPDEKNKYFKQHKFIVRIAARYESYYDNDSKSIDILRSLGWNFI
ncbi:PIG-L family deacetylase [Clostridium sp.]